jgi:hypothetical protein
MILFCVTSVELQNSQLSQHTSFYFKCDIFLKEEFKSCFLTYESFFQNY